MNISGASRFKNTCEHPRPSCRRWKHLTTQKSWPSCWARRGAQKRPPVLENVQGPCHDRRPIVRALQNRDEPHRLSLIVFGQHFRMSGHDPCASHCVPAARKILERGDVGREVVHHEDDEIPAPVMRIMSVLNRTLTSSTGSTASAMSKCNVKCARNKLSSEMNGGVHPKHVDVVRHIV